MQDRGFPASRHSSNGPTSTTSPETASQTESPPSSSAPTSSPPSSSEGPEARKSSPRLIRTALVADDDANFRRQVVEKLREEGYQVYEAPSGIEVLHILTSRATRAPRLDQIDILITNHRMPGLTGLEVIRSLRTRHFNAPCILMSAFPDAWLRGQAHELAATLIRKPFTLADLFEMAEGLLSTAPKARLAAGMK